MIIKKIELNKERGFLTVWTDADENVGFNFKIKDIVDKPDLINKVKLRVQEYLAKQQEEKDYETKFELLRSLEGMNL